MPKITAIIPTYNSARFLPQAIESVFSQSFQDFELIVVDDGSTDDTEDILGKYAPRIKAIQQDNRGPGAARNSGIKLARGDYLVFLDADDVLFPQKIESQAAFLDHHPEIGVVFSDVECFIIGEDGYEQTKPFPTSIQTRGSLGKSAKTLEIFAIQNVFPPLAAMVRRSCVEAVSGFDESRNLIGLEDWDLWFRIAQNYNFHYLDQLVGRYRIVSSSVSQNQEGMKRAAQLLERKIETSSGFESLASIVRSDFYLCWGLQWLDYGEPEMAKDRFKESIEVDSHNLLARGAYVLTKLIGRRAVSFYHIKRKIFGVGGDFRTVRISSR